MPTLGKTTNGASAQTFTTDRKIASQATPLTNGTVTDGTVRMRVTSGSHAAKMVTYSDSAGEPANLLASSDEVAFSNTSEAAVNFTFSGANQLAITSGTAAWIGVHYAASGVSVSVSRDNTVALAGSKNDTYSDSAAASWGTIVNNNGAIDVFLNYTEPTPPAGSSVFFAFF